MAVRTRNLGTLYLVAADFHGPIYEVPADHTTIVKEVLAGSFTDAGSADVVIYTGTELLPLAKLELQSGAVEREACWCVLKEGWVLYCSTTGSAVSVVVSGTQLYGEVA